ncbi:pyridoxamine 5'-phosphate oxidase family protein [Saccharomonospora sp. NPDC046836]|uniref:pyridoxamine 5'-phosphate oxidase family protein n=1 Tax=Saccharomonospora sp. NPDC046836 TaxID=3156921 RepID=UPI0033D1D134
MNNRPEMHALTEQECLDLLPTVRLGRVVFNQDALPAIRTVNFVVDGRSIIVRTTHNGCLARLHQSVVAFEADEVDADLRCGWSVVVLGRAQRITDIDTIVALCDPSSRSWAPGARDLFLRIPVEMVSGRRLTSSDIPA